MAAVSLFWDTNMAAVTSRENTLLVGATQECEPIEKKSGYAVKSVPPTRMHGWRVPFVASKKNTFRLLIQVNLFSVRLKIF